MLTLVPNWYSGKWEPIKAGEICCLIFESNVVIMTLKKFQDDVFRENVHTDRSHAYCRKKVTEEGLEYIWI